MMRRWPFICITVLGFIFILIGITLPILFLKYRDRQLDQKFVLRSDSENMENFIEPPITFYRSFYFFNVTNPEEILLGQKPRVEEVGPFVYTEKKRKANIVWDDLEDTVSFSLNNTFHFQPHLSGSFSESTQITTVNSVMLALASMAADHTWTEAVHGLLEILVWRFNMEPFVTHSAGELLFKGYEEDIIRAMAPLTEKEVHYTGKFGFFYPTNFSLTPLQKIGTGADDISKLMEIVEVDGKSELTSWNSAKCNELRGTVSAPFPRPVTRDANIYMFSAGLCRSIYFGFKEDNKMGKLDVYRFDLPYSLLAVSEENSCYCTNDFACRPSMAYLGPCKGGAPMVASYPHFYMGSQTDIDSVEGLHPIEEKHITFVDIEPITGISVRARKRIQVNMPLRRYANLPSLQKVPEVIFPILWMDQSVDLANQTLDIIYNSVVLPSKVINYICYTLLVLGIWMVIISVTIFMIKKVKARKSETKDLAERKKESEKPFIEHGNGVNSKPEKINLTKK